MGFSSRVELTPPSGFSTAAAKEKFFARVQATGLLTGVVSTAGDHFLGGLDLHDMNFICIGRFSLPSPDSVYVYVLVNIRSHSRLHNQAAVNERPCVWNWTSK